MNCKHVQNYLDSFLVEKPVDELHSDIAEHIANCPRCARDYESAVQALNAIRLTGNITLSPGLKDSIMNRISEAGGATQETVKPGFSVFKLWKPVVITGAAVMLFVIGSLFLQPANDNETDIAVNLLHTVWAAEQAVFDKAGVVHCVNEIIVKPVRNPVLSQLRWLPVISIESDGTQRFHQLTLPAETGEGYTVDDEAWYDPETGRFKRIISIGKAPVFANSFDGDTIHVLEKGIKGNLQVAAYPLSPNFKPPENPSEFLGISVGLTTTLNEKDNKQVSYEGNTVLKDGSKARILKVGFGTDGPELSKSTYFLYKIREADNTIAEIEWFAQNNSLLVVRRVRTETLDTTKLKWSLAGLDSKVHTTTKQLMPGIQTDMVIPDVSVQHMIEKADFETYIFESGPPWAGRHVIADVLDIVSPPHRMFSIAYRADDSRHVVLIQSHSYNRMASHVQKTATLSYTSPNGFKVWSDPKAKWMARILLQSAGAVIKDQPSDDCTGYILESPAGIYPCIAINGELTDNELHSLIDSLIPSIEYAGKD